MSNSRVSISDLKNKVHSAYGLATDETKMHKSTRKTILNDDRRTRSEASNHFIRER